MKVNRVVLLIRAHHIYRRYSPSGLLAGAREKGLLNASSNPRERPDDPLLLGDANRSE